MAKAIEIARFGALRRATVVIRGLVTMTFPLELLNPIVLFPFFTRDHCQNFNTFLL